MAGNLKKLATRKNLGRRGILIRNMACVLLFLCCKLVRNVRDMCDKWVGVITS